MKKILGILCILFPSLIFAQEVRVDFEEYTLNNGLHVILCNNEAATNVIVGVKYHLGSKNEKQGRTGLAHFIEHVQFHGTKNIPQGDFERVIMNAGGYCNAYTNYDVTYFYDILPAHEYKVGLWAEAERMLHPVYTKEKFEKEREIVLQERNLRYYGSPLKNSYNDVMIALHNPLTYGHSMIGKLEDLNATTVDDIRTFVDKYYKPVNACLVVAGKIDVNKVKKWVDVYFKDIPSGEKIPCSEQYYNLPKKEKRIEKVKKNLKDPAVLIAYNAIPETHEDASALNFINTLLYSGDASFCYFDEYITKKTPWVSKISSSIEIWEKVGFLKFQAKLKGKGHENQLINKVQEVLNKLKNEPISETKLEELKNMYENSMVDSYFHSETLADLLTAYHFIFGSTEKINNMITDFKKVTVKDIQRVASKYFIPENRTVIVYKPEK